MAEEMKFNGFSNYKQTVFQITDDLKKLREFSEKLKLDGNVSAINEVLKRLAEDTFNVAIIGEFKRGKSTIINALLEKDVIPMDILPCSATLNKVSYGITPFVKIEYKDGKSEEIGIDQLNNYVTKLTKESEERAKQVKEATVYYPVNYCKNGVTIIDTPGLNDDAAMTEVTISILPHIDAAIMAISARAPFSESERNFLESKLITSDLGRILFVVTYLEGMDEDEAEKIVKNITDRIQEYVINKAKKLYGENSKEFEKYKHKIGNVKVYGVAGKNALKAKLKGDNDLLKQSGFPVFEEALERFLTEDRGAIMMSVPVNRIKTSSIELAKAVQLREVALAMQKDQFDVKFKQAMEDIEKLRSERQAEFSNINETAQRTYNELVPLINNYWPSLENAAAAAIENFPIAPDDIKKEALQVTQENLINAIKTALTNESQNVSERIQTAIELALEKEAERISGFEEKFFQVTNKIHDLFTNENLASDSGNNDGTVAGNLAGALVGGWIGGGIGGVIMGYKQAGFKGALLGGATGLVGALGGAVGAGLLVGALALPLSWPVLLIGGIAAGLTGTFTSKWALGKFFVNDKIEKFKNSFKESVNNELAKMKAEDSFSESVHNQIETAFEALKNKIKTETENILSDTQNQLTQLKIELAKAESSGEKEKEELAKILKTVDAICNRANTIANQLAAVITRQAV